MNKQNFLFAVIHSHRDKAVLYPSFTMPDADFSDCELVSGANI